MKLKLLNLIYTTDNPVKIEVLKAQGAVEIKEEPKTIEDPIVKEEVSEKEEPEKTKEPKEIKKKKGK
ncbi:MAG: hypothetical protein Q4Q07_10355 [Tissierellia bacterium]|nr:hypothetical protein [Tissierellia bacterium]